MNDFLTRLFWALLILWGIYSLNRLYHLLIGISDDINEMKQKLGLRIIARTPAQNVKQLMDLIRFEIHCGKSLEELKEEFRAKELRKLKNWIEVWMKEVKDKKCKVCYSCMKVFEVGSQAYCKDTCSFCNKELYDAEFLKKGNNETRPGRPNK